MVHHVLIILTKKMKLIKGLQQFAQALSLQIVPTVFPDPAFLINYPFIFFTALSKWNKLLSQLKMLALESTFVFSSICFQTFIMKSVNYTQII